MNSRRLIPSMGFPSWRRMGAGAVSVRRSPPVLDQEDSTSGAYGRLPHCGISLASAVGFPSLMGHEQIGSG